MDTESASAVYTTPRAWVEPPSEIKNAFAAVTVCYGSETIETRRTLILRSSFGRSACRTEVRMYRVFVRSLETVMLVAFAAVVGATSGSAQSSRTDRDAPANLTGAWALNKELSDDAAKLMEAMQGGDHGGSGGQRPPVGGHGPGMHGGGGTGGSRGGMTPEQMRAIRSDVLASQGEGLAEVARGGG